MGQDPPIIQQPTDGINNLVSYLVFFTSTGSGMGFDSLHISLSLTPLRSSQILFLPKTMVL
jgi:predicted permease